MQHFQPDAAAHFRQFEGFDEVSRVGPAMQELIARYDLAGKRVLSVGAGIGIEEFHLWKAGCKLIMCDIDEQASLRPLLEQLPASGDDALHFYIGDAAELVRARPGLVDVCYFSGFTPDERLRDSIKQSSAGGWRRDARPFSEISTSIFSQGLGAGGLLISQSYCGGVSPFHYPEFCDAIKAQLSSCGFSLCELYCLAPIYGVTLMVARKGSPAEAAQYVRALSERAALTTFHGRCETTPTQIVKVYGDLTVHQRLQQLLMRIPLIRRARIKHLNAG